MKSRLTSTLVFVGVYFLLFGHPKVFAGGIEGTITDIASGEALSYATVAIFNQSDSTLVSGTIADDAGYFMLSELTIGKYYLEINFVGYHVKTLSDLVIDNKRKKIVLGQLGMTSASSELNEVTVTVDRAKIEHHLDKDVINVAEQMTAAGGSTTDVIARHPSVSVDMEGNVNLRGSSDFTVLMDGRPTMMSASELLQSIPASSLEKIEVITNPSAKFNAEASAGIINLITKKKSALDGVSGQVSLAGISNASYRTSLNLNYKRDQLTLFVEPSFVDDNSLHFKYDYNFLQENENDELVPFRNGSGLFKRLPKRSALRVGTSYQIDERNEVILSFTGSEATHRFKNEEHMRDFESDQMEYVILGNGSQAKWSNRGYHFTHIYQINGQAHQLETSASFYSNESNRGMYQREWESDEYSQRLTMLADGFNQTFLDVNRTWVNANYVKKTGDISFETGIQIDLDARDVDLNLIREIDQPGGVEDGAFEFKRNIYATYFSLDRTLLGVEVNGGIRAEYTDRSLEIIHPEPQLLIYKKMQLFPNFSLLKKVDETRSIRFNYGRRIDRPRERFLSPLVFHSNRNADYKGNPKLRPAITDSYELSYARHLPSSSITLTIYQRNTKDRYMSTLVLEDSVVVWMQRNVNKSQDTGLEFNLSYEKIKWIELNPSFTIRANHLKGRVGDLLIDNQNFVWTADFSPTFKISEHTSFQVEGRYVSTQLRPQGETRPNFGLNASLRQNFFDRSLSMTLSATDLLNSQRFGGYNEGPGFYRESKGRRSFTIYRLALNYNFNNHKRVRVRTGGAPSEN